MVTKELLESVHMQIEEGFFSKKELFWTYAGKFLFANTNIEGAVKIMFQNNFRNEFTVDISLATEDAETRENYRKHRKWYNNLLIAKFCELKKDEITFIKMQDAYKIKPEIQILSYSIRPSQTLAHDIIVKYKLGSYIGDIAIWKKINNRWLYESANQERKDNIGDFFDFCDWKSYVYNHIKEHSDLRLLLIT